MDFNLRECGNEIDDFMEITIRSVNSIQRLDLHSSKTRAVGEYQAKESKDPLPDDITSIKHKPSQNKERCKTQ